VRVLFVTKFLPLPANSGGKQRSAALLTRLTRLGDVTVAALDDGTADRAALEALGVQVLSASRPGRLAAGSGALRAGSVSAGRFYSRRLRSAVRMAVHQQEPDVMVVAYAQLAPYAACAPRVPKVLDLHNIESSLFVSYADSRRGLPAAAALAESRALRRIERRALATYDVVSVVSQVDLARLPAPHPNVLVCPNGWEPSAALPPAADPVVSFVGLMGWTPNVDAAVWLVEAVWPEVRARVPGAQLRLVGRDPAPAVRALAGADISVTGTVPDVTPHLAAARVVVAPLRAGGGSRLKVLEGLDAGRPVVATTVGAEGLERLVGRGVVLADEPATFAEAIVRLLLDPEEAAALGAVGRRAVHASFSWDATLASLLAAVRARPG
jgi:glycosyltransferase involved in cell wall biosynthesis